MALTVSFSVSQYYTSPSVIVWTDTSTGTDVAVTKRRIFLQLADGSYLVPDGTTTAYIETTESTVELDVLTEDKAINITVQWLDNSNTVLYDSDSLDTLFCFPMYAKNYLSGLTTAQTGNSQLVKDGDYWHNKIEMLGWVKSAEDAVTFNADIYGAQYCLDKAATFIDNPVKFF